MENLLRPLRPLEAGVNRTAQGQPHGLNLGPSSSSYPMSLTSSSESGALTKRKTCTQCRIRKVRCDGRQIICQNCERLEFECSFQQSLGSRASPHYVDKVPERRRRTQACTSCRRKKTRCLGELPECSNCVRRGLVCAYPERKRKSSVAGAESSPQESPGNQTGGHATSSGDNDVRPDDEVDAGESSEEANLDYNTLIELVGDYFRHLYPLPSYAFLHKATVLQRCQDKTIDSPLKLAICAITCLQLQRTAFCHDIWVQRAEQLMLQQLGQPSIFHLQALLLVIRYRIESGEFRTAFMLAALAARSAVALRLNYERSELSPLAQEARRRLFWSLFLLDDFFCVGLREFELCPKETIHLQLPCDEELFEAGQYCRTGTLDQDPLEVSATIGLKGVFLRVVYTRREIMRFIRHLHLREIYPLSISESIQRFEEQLNSLHSSLSQTEQYSVTNLISCKLQAQFLTLHASWHQCFCDLYRQFLEGYSEAAPSSMLTGIHPTSRRVMQQRCVEHAEKIIQIVADFWNHGDRASPLERDTAVCAFESTRIVLFHASLSGVAALMEGAIRKAQMCLEVITHFFAYSASAKSMRNKLERLISSYSARLALQHKESLREPEAPEPRPNARVSQYANSRQRLSVQSLLLQSDFVDDSDEIAVPSAWHEGVSRHGQGDCVGESPASVSELSDGALTGDFTLGPVEVGVSDEGLGFNPWMGFPGKDDFFGMQGLSGHLDERF